MQNYLAEEKHLFIIYDSIHLNLKIYINCLNVLQNNFQRSYFLLFFVINQYKCDSGKEYFILIYN